MLPNHLKCVHITFGQESTYTSHGSLSMPNKREHLRNQSGHIKIPDSAMTPRNHYCIARILSPSLATHVLIAESLIASLLLYAGAASTYVCILDSH